MILTHFLFVLTEALEITSQKAFAQRVLTKIRSPKYSGNTSDASSQSDFAIPAASFDSHKECVTQREFNDLKEEVRRLKKKVKDLQSGPSAGSAPTNDFHTMLEESPKSSTAHQSALWKSPIEEWPKSYANSSALWKPPIEESPKSYAHQSALWKSSIPGEQSRCDVSAATSREGDPSISASTSDSNTYNGMAYSTLQDLVAHCDKVYDAVKILLTTLFPREYILTHSVSGKAPNKSTPAKEPFDTRLFSAMVNVIKNKYPEISSKKITEKVQSVQKYVQKH
ncbi:uncharacterized protein [Ptychodera flava]|uniref:uncharacterized protein isoform X1 n=1 Tax=Ptychodera flava TaxID=63121 RepID=UPI003969CDF9